MVIQVVQNMNVVYLSYIHFILELFPQLWCHFIVK